jgi:hypothetical protein
MIVVKNMDEKPNATCRSEGGIVDEADCTYFEENALANNWYERLTRKVSMEPGAAPLPDPCLTCAKWVEYAGPPSYEGGNDHFCTLTLKEKGAAVKCITHGYKDREPVTAAPHSHGTGCGV